MKTIKNSLKNHTSKPPAVRLLPTRSGPIQSGLDHLQAGAALLATT